MRKGSACVDADCKRWRPKGKETHVRPLVRRGPVGLTQVLGEYYACAYGRADAGECAGPGYQQGGATADVSYSARLTTRARALYVQAVAAS